MKKPVRRSKEVEAFTVTVRAASAFVSRLGPKAAYLSPEGESRTYITIEGDIDPPLVKRTRSTKLAIHADDNETGNPGASIGGNEFINVVCTLPRPQFADLLAIVLYEKLKRVSLVFQGLNRGQGPLISAGFYTTEEDGD